MLKLNDIVLEEVVGELFYGLDIIDLDKIKTEKKSIYRTTGEIVIVLESSCFGGNEYYACPWVHTNHAGCLITSVNKSIPRYFGNNADVVQAFFIKRTALNAWLDFICVKNCQFMNFWFYERDRITVRLQPGDVGYFLSPDSRRQYCCLVPGKLVHVASTDKIPLEIDELAGVKYHGFALDTRVACDNWRWHCFSCEKPLTTDNRLSWDIDNGWIGIVFPTIQHGVPIIDIDRDCTVHVPWHDKVCLGFPKGSNLIVDSNGVVIAKEERRNRIVSYVLKLKKSVDRIYITRKSKKDQWVVN